MHYPFNYVLLNKWFQQVQVPVYVIFNSFFIGAAVLIIHNINNDKSVKMKTVFKKTLSSYIHLIVACVVAVVVLFGLSSFYGLLMRRALTIRSISGIFFMIKQAVLLGAPYVNLLFAVIVTSVFAFVIPIIVIEKKKVFSAIILNFKNLWKSFFVVFTVIFLSGLIYVPILLLRSSGQLFRTVMIPEAWGITLIISVFVSLFIDALQYTAITTFYLLKKESK